MKSGLLACIFAFYATLMACAVGGYTYFATFVHNEIYPYFREHRTETQYNEARLVFTFLVISAVLIWCFFLSTVLTLFIDTGKYWNERRRPWPICDISLRIFIPGFCMIVVVVLAVLILLLAWGWWDYFESAKMDWFASHCHGLRGMIIAILVIIDVSFVLGTLLRTHLRSRSVPYVPR
ncbi:uncharacterized protein F4812DRAFT_406131 [Daldinia caldariorum]|uniref:uncharacterized protein n=1 Tax=Daldinia caldariorum TaxID=326644 RepID=UPI002007C642|nr:uncharacterized protein F4812DRAFT_406131 [Daldinia caldariorum]KAI1467717.1 hypothetical protein F4812DRAFT_406131 [Daldinia caldariorum]